MNRQARIQDGEWLATARLLRRIGFGTTGSDVDRALPAGRSVRLAAALTAEVVVDPGVVGTPEPQLAPIDFADHSTEAKKARNKELRRQGQELTQWWLARMIAVEEPLIEKATLWWHNHFATAISKVKVPALMQLQNQTLRRHARGDFQELASAMLVDGAMVRWLDGQQNTAAAPNENLSREFMELFTLGHGGGYTEQDVREGARALTGRRLRPDGTTALMPGRHDAGAKTFLGMTGNLGESDFLAAIFGQAFTATHVSARTYRQLVSDLDPSAQTLSLLADPFGVDWSIAGLLERMLTADDFITAMGTTVISPVEWAVGAARALRLPFADRKESLALLKALKSLGQLPFDPPSVAGWPSGSAWLSTASVTLRMQTATAMTAKADLDIVAAAAVTERVDVTGHLLGIGQWSERSRKVLQDNVSDPKRLVAIALNTAEYLTH